MATQFSFADEVAKKAAGKANNPGESSACTLASLEVCAGVRRLAILRNGAARC